MKVIVNDCYTEKDQKAFHAGIQQLNEACEKMHSTSFMKASVEQRKALLIALDKEAKAFQKA
ncbi:gluconate 2-dehydrogenase subunit 3 family protein, partial [Vibrio parahaemolyticus]